MTAPTLRLRLPVLLKALLLGPALFGTTLFSRAQAVTYDFSTSAVSGGSQPFTVRAGVSDVLLGGNRFSLAVSNRAAEVGAVRNQPLLTIGTVNLNLNAAYVFAQPGVRLAAGAGGTLGPVALSASGEFWSTPAADQEPLSVWNLVAPAVSPLGAQANLEARYRVSRTLIATLSGELGAQSRVSLSGEWRSGDLSYRLGAAGGVNVLGALAGVTYRADAFTFSADALLGRTSGGTLSLDAPALIALNDEQAIDLSAYLTYEPWRSAALPLRYGLDADVPLGQVVDGHLKLGLRGGSGGLGVRAGYTFTPGAATQTPEPEPVDPPAEPSPTDQPTTPATTQPTTEPPAQP
ncbi:hypothetical protein [Deinococcus alpinitundrae]|uniref:hypothetical protein n=1 Tax=Deinococcus alpinitundrae TaxID=468913 RepID=UPI001379BB01|nr:hypothetical protein [Deinococcus alpinitundrae]